MGKLNVDPKSMELEERRLGILKQMAKLDEERLEIEVKLGYEDHGEKSVSRKPAKVAKSKGTGKGRGRPKGSKNKAKAQKVKTIPEGATLERGIVVFAEKGRGRKQCPNCQKFIGARVPVCVCGYDWKTEKVGEPPVAKEEVLVTPETAETAAASEPTAIPEVKNYREDIIKALGTSKTGYELVKLINKMMAAGVEISSADVIEAELQVMKGESLVAHDEKTRKWSKVA
jgi:hypothetical protein